LPWIKPSACARAHRPTKRSAIAVNFRAVLRWSQVPAGMLPADTRLRWLTSIAMCDAIPQFLTCTSNRKLGDFCGATRIAELGEVIKSPLLVLRILAKQGHTRGSLIGPRRKGWKSLNVRVAFHPQWRNPSGGKMFNPSFLFNGSAWNAGRNRKASMITRRNSRAKNEAEGCKQHEKVRRRKVQDDSQSQAVGY